jgi:hypothetical protein
MARLPESTEATLVANLADITKSIPQGGLGKRAIVFDPERDIGIPGRVGYQKAVRTQAFAYTRGMIKQVTGVDRPDDVIISLIPGTNWVSILQWEQLKAHETKRKAAEGRSLLFDRIDSGCIWEPDLVSESPTGNLSDYNEATAIRLVKNVFGIPELKQLQIKETRQAVLSAIADSMRRLEMGIQFLNAG